MQLRYHGPVSHPYGGTALPTTGHVALLPETYRMPRCLDPGLEAEKDTLCRQKWAEGCAVLLRNGLPP